ncbi:Uncharacterized conserved protein YndB, AHSA1/START domain [Amycolatopsis pretoriensis]|uniref:Uncharacterized conserved protein YndB, AHSA1/START domain n=1 Tax=Amycolatopsis pretoriensis TaxID=218821 RepID=A0A1H5R7C2_9PSEU|nr:SRPBCC domain-containing protein [Amycolatopsis pretoriensis]SEF34273.1 Uncharacterized conserved protein YndB, AHSA1/START domain [Amycolatopsis pretoriensis]
MPDLTITRVFDAPRELVYAAWTEPDHVASWFGPQGFTCTAVTVAPRPGGRWRACIHSPEGEDLWVGGVYREVDAPERLAFTFAWEAREPETLVEIGFADLGGKTEMTFTQTGFPTAAERDDHDEGWTSSFEDLTGHLRGKDAR